MIDDSAARRDWHWHPHFGLEAIVEDMLAHIPLQRPVQAKAA